MKRFSLYVVALAAAVTLTSVAAAAPDAAKQLNLPVGVAITTKGAYYDWNTSGRGTFVLTPLRAGALKRDSGTVSATVNTWRLEGKVAILDHFEGFKGKRGSLVIRSTIKWVDAGNGQHRGTGTWKVMHGTGQYAKVTGRGMRKDVWREGGRGPWSARRVGLLTLP
jgi:hypothetical protein